MRSAMKLTLAVLPLLAMLAIGVLLFLASCAPMTPLRGTSPVPSAVKPAACAEFAPIGWSKNDTDETIRAVKAHNAVYVELCGVPSFFPLR